MASLFNIWERAAQTPPAQRHSPESVEAGKAIAPALGRLQERVLDYFRGRGADGATDAELQDFFADQAQATSRARRVELVQAGLLRPSGRKRPTRSGRSAMVWLYCGGV